MNDLTVGSLFSGVGGIDLGLERAGMRVVFQAESDPWCRGILERHWPDVPCYHDVRSVRLDRGRLTSPGPDVDPGGLPLARNRSVDLLCGGFPCQDVSVAGRRAGLTGGERSSLFFEFARIAGDLVRPGGWVLIENVPGLLSSHNGRDFAVVLATLAELGFHDLAWRVLDSRYFGVPQRRRRVFIVGRRAVGNGAREVLLEPESGGGDFAPGREARSRASLVAEGGAVQSLDRQSGGPERGTPLITADVPIEGEDQGRQRGPEGADRLDGAPAYPHGMRTTPIIPGRVDDPQPDGPRYAAMGNAVTVNVAEWIGRRIMSYESEAA